MPLQHAQPVAQVAQVGVIAGQLSASVADDGTLDASVSAEFDLRSLPDVPPGLGIDFGKVTLTYDANFPLRPFRAVARAAGARARFSFGTTGTEACLLGEDVHGNEINLVCFLVPLQN